MNRRGFLASCLALGAAPAIVRADSLMRIMPVETEILPASALFYGKSIPSLLAEQQIGARMALARQLVAYRVMRDRGKPVIEALYQSDLAHYTLTLKGIE